MQAAVSSARGQTEKRRAARQQTQQSGNTEEEGKTGTSARFPPIVCKSVCACRPAKSCAFTPCVSPRRGMRWDADSGREGGERVLRAAGTFTDGLLHPGHVRTKFPCHFSAVTLHGYSMARELPCEIMCTSLGASVRVEDVSARRLAFRMRPGGVICPGLKARPGHRRKGFGKLFEATCG